MKHVYLLAGAAFALVLVACGGSGGGNSSANGGANGTTSGLPVAPAGAHVEAVVSAPTTFDNGSQTNGQQFIYQDPTNIEAQDQVTFQLVYEDSDGTRHVLPTNNWSTTDTSSTFGTLIYNSGTFAANTAQTTTAQTVATLYNGITYSTQYDILPRQVRLRGQVLADDTKAPLAGVEIDFYGPENPLDPTSTLVFRGHVMTAFDGTFRASIPSSVTNFYLANASLPKGYQNKRYYRYKGSYFHTNDITCFAALPAYANGERFMIDYTNPNLATNGTILLLSDKEPTPSAACGN
ncbi:MAG TPA: hypothetical protein VG944_23125 [Fimbriimonas sp.]|nr:hypothetical protein [Fimbriimonas sp.]